METTQPTLEFPPSFPLRSLSIPYFVSSPLVLPRRLGYSLSPFLFLFFFTILPITRPFKFTIRARRIPRYKFLSFATGFLLSVLPLSIFMIRFIPTSVRRLAGSVRKFSSESIRRGLISHVPFRKFLSFDDARFKEYR